MPNAYLCLAIFFAASAFAQVDPGAPVPAPNPAPAEVFDIWPGAAPDETADIGPEIMLTERRRPFYQITNVSKPTVSVYLPAPEKATGAGMLVLPGGGLARLAIEHEGFEAAEWLTDNGIAAFVVKYRVPPRTENPRERWKAGLQDAQRAMSIVRSRANEWGIDPQGIGAIGFSAGGEIGTLLSLYGEERQYRAIDFRDEQPTPPNFMLNIYPGGLTFGREDPAVREQILSRIGERTPPMFFAHAFHDASMNSILMVRALKQKRVGAELHLFQDGGHGFGVRESGMPLAAWRNLALTWMRSQGFLDPPHVRSYPGKLSEAWRSKPPLTVPITELHPATTMDEAYAAQRRVNAAYFAGEKPVGYKGAAASKASQAKMETAQPFHCVLFRSGVLEAAETPSLSLDDLGPALAETKLGYVMAIDISTKVKSPSQARFATEAVVAAVDLAPALRRRPEGKLTARDYVAANCGAGSRVLVGARSHPDEIDPDQVEISLSHGGKKLHSATAAEAEGGQWGHLMTLINEIVGRGRMIQPGDIILSGALGEVHEAKPGSYSANFGQLGKIEFTVE